MGWLCATSAWILLRIGCPVARAAAAAGVVGVRGFEPPAPASRTQCSTRLSYTPAEPRHIAFAPARGKLQKCGGAAADRGQVPQALHRGRHADHDLEQLAGVGTGEA